MGGEGGASLAYFTSHFCFVESRVPVGKTGLRTCVCVQNFNTPEALETIKGLFTMLKINSK